MAKTQIKNKKNRKSNPNNKTFLVQVRMSENVKEMLTSIKDDDLERDPDVIRRLIKAEFERKNSEKVSEVS